MSSFDDYQCSIARIYNQNNIVIGTGFFIFSKYLLTCAHVVKDALDLEIDDLIKVPLESIKIDLPCSQFNQTLTAKVIFLNPCLKEKITDAQRGEDIACLEIESNLSLPINPIKLTTLDDISNHPFKIYGFPEKAGSKGMSAEGKIKGNIAEGWLELEPLQQRPITGGFSGSPVWDTSAKRFIGMTVASNQDQDDEGKIVNVAFAISNHVLIDYCLKLVELYSFFQTESQEIITIIKEIYTQIAPSDWQNKPESILSILQDLNNMPSLNNDNFSPLHQFVIDLILHRKCSNNLKNNLQEWGKNNIDDFDNQIHQREQVIKQQEKYQNQTYLILIIHPSTKGSKKFIISGSVIIEKISLSSNKREVEKEEKFDLEIEQQEELLDINQLEDKLESIIQDLIKKSEDYLYGLERKPTLVCFLPRKLMTKSINNFQVVIPSDDEEDDELISKPLGTYCPVIIRSYQRLNIFGKEYLNKDKWMTNWSNLQSQSCCQLFMDDQKLNYENSQQIEATLNLNRPKALKLSKNPNNAILKFIHEEGIPACLWIRNNYQVENLEEEFSFILSCSINSLSHKIMKKHLQAISENCECPEKHIGHHLSLMLEDPYLLPTTINYS